MCMLKTVSMLLSSIQCRLTRVFSIYSAFLVNIKKEDNGEEHQLKRNEKGRKVSMKKKHTKRSWGNPSTEAVRRRHYISLWGRETDAAKLWMKRGLSFHLGQPFGWRRRGELVIKLFIFLNFFKFMVSKRWKRCVYISI